MKRTKIALVFVMLFALCLGIFAACEKKPQQDAGLTSAKDYLYTQYKASDNGETPADFDRVGAVMINGTRYSIEWTVNVKTAGQEEGVKVVKKDDGSVTIDVNEQTAVDIVYELVATISNAEGKTVTVTFHHTVPMFKELTWEQYMATEKGKSVVIKGKVASISSKSTGDKYNCMYIYDNDGGYYIYALTEDPLTTYPTLALGMTVQVTGEKDIYNGTHEVKSATFKVLDEATTIEFADITDIFAATEDMKDESLTSKAYMPVEIKNVIIGDIDTDNSYYYFTIGASKSYLRISSSDNMLSEDETKAFKAGFAALKGKYATVKGLATVYSGAFYIQVITADAAVEQAAPEKDPAGQIEDVKGRLAIDTKISGSGRTFDLPTQDTVYNNVNIAWAADADVASIANGKVTYTFTEDGTVKLTATLTHATDATVSATKEFTVELSVGTAVTVKEFLAKSVSEDEVYILTGYIVAADKATGTKGSFVFADATGSVFSYEKFDVTVGDKVKIIAKRAVNYGVPQLGTINVTKLEKAEGESYTYPEATELKAEEIDLSALSATSVVPMTGVYYKITGTILYKNGTYTSSGTAGETAGSYNQVISVYAASSLIDANLYGKEVVIYGYVRGFSTGKYLTIQTVKITEKEKTATEKLNEAKEALTSVTAEGGDQFADSFTLVTEGANGTTISWKIKEEGVTALTINGANATVTKPETDVNLTLVATISLEGTTETVEKEFAITITATIPTYTVTIATVEGATLTVMNGETAVETGATVNKGTELTLTVTVANGYILKNVKNGTTVLTAEDGSYKVTVNDDVTLSVELIKISTIAEFKALAVNQEGAVVGIVTNVDSKAVWIQNAEGDALYVYANGKLDVEVGKQITVTGKRGEYNGLKQLANPVLVSQEATETVITAATLDETKYNALVADDAAKLVSISRLEYVSGTANSSKGGTLTFKLGATSISVRVEKGDADALNEGILSSLVAGDIVNLKNVNIGWFNTAQVAISKAAQIEKVELTDAEKLALIIAKINTTVAADFTLDSSVTWTVKSGTAITIAEGKATVTRPAEGEEDATVVLTATLGEATQDVTITVKAQSSVVTLKETVSIADYKDANGWKDTTQYNTLNGMIFTVTVAGGGNTGKYYDNGKDWRLYGSESAKLTITAKEGYTIKSVKITYTAKNNGILENGAEKYKSGASITVESSSIALTVTTGQVRITSIEVEYVAA